MEENIISAEKAEQKPFFVSALIVEAVALLIAAAVLLGIRLAVPDTFERVKRFYGEKIAWSAKAENKAVDRTDADEI